MDGLDFVKQARYLVMSIAERQALYAAMANIARRAAATDASKANAIEMILGKIVGEMANAENLEAELADVIGKLPESFREAVFSDVNDPTSPLQVVAALDECILQVEGDYVPEEPYIVGADASVTDIDEYFRNRGKDNEGH